MKTIGIIGGMGPLATADLYHKIIVMTEAGSDQEHPRVFIDGNTKIPDRTAAILRGGPDPVPELTASAKRLEVSGADFLMMACNTAHYYYGAVASSVTVPVLHMPRETAEEIRRRGHKKVALLATSGTVETRIYHDAFAGSGIEIITPDESGQREVMGVIYDGVKANRTRYDTVGFSACLKKLGEGGAELFILGCTELPLAFEWYGVKAPAIDPAAVLAAAALREAGCRRKTAE